MKQLLLLASCLLLALSAFGATEKYVEVNRSLDVPSFIGWVEDEIIVVVKESAMPAVAQRQATDNALGALPEFAPLAERFDVIGTRKQFATRTFAASASASENAMARYFKVKFQTGALDEVLAAYAALPSVEHVEPIGIHTLMVAANDTYYDNPPASFPYDQWHYWDTHSVDADQAWDTQAGDPTVVVGILDSGTRYFHLDLGGDNAQWGPNNPQNNGNIFINNNEVPGNGVDDDNNGYIDDVIGWDFVATAGGAGVSCIDQDCGTADNDPDDGDGHGTHVAGTVGAITNNNRQVAGVAGGFSDGTTSGAGNGVKILPLRIGYHARYHGITTGIVRMDYAAEAMNYLSDLVDAGVNVASINCSWGSSNSGGLGAAVTNLLAHDVVICVAAGNSNSSSTDYLGGRGDCMDVAATDRNGNGASFTNYGSWVDVAAPGVEILSTFRNPDDPDPTAHYIALLDGTSMSSPHVAGIIALLESCNPALTGPQKYNLVVNNTTPYSDSRDLGSGIANAYLALQAASCAAACDVVANFSGTPTSGCGSVNVAFTDQSTGPVTGWSWDFGDGTGSSSQNPSHTYGTPGTYAVSLTVSSSSCQSTETKTGFVTVQATPVADFSGSPVSGTAPLAVTFTDLSSGGPSSWSWNFGDGGSSAAQNPSHNYTSAGTYTVTLTASNGCGSDIATKTNYITVTQPTVDIMHVASIAVTREAKGPNVNGLGTVTIVNQNGQPVANATVSVLVTGPTGGTGSAATNGSGVVSFQSSKTKNPSGEWCFEVTNVTHASNTYDELSNVVTKACESGPVFGNSEPIVFSETLPHEVQLDQNYPNPFNPSTEISFSLPAASRVRLDIFNLLGQTVTVLADGQFGAGNHVVRWDASGSPSGIYFYRLTTGLDTRTRKMILLK